MSKRKKLSKGGKEKSSQCAQSKNQPQLSTSSYTSAINVWRPLVHLRQNCHQDTFYIRCRSRSHNTEMCHAPTKSERLSNICIYCGSKNHSVGKCTNRPNDNREEPRSTPRDLQDHRAGNTGNNNHIFSQNRDSHKQARFDERFYRQYSPNYNNYQPSPIGSIPGQDLSTTLIELANIQSRSLEIMVANQRS